MLVLKNVSKKFQDFSLKSVGLTINNGDYFILLGESGAGKSMLLETIAGLVRPETGIIMMEGKDITQEKIQSRKIGLVFQDHAVFPHMNVFENIAYSLYGRKLKADKRKELVIQIAKQLSISELLNRHPSTLSGGELQRVALARTLIQEPNILLLDEPLASLDSRKKSELRSLLRNLHRQGQTIFHVTHDYEEALSLGTRIAVIHDGAIVQEGTPADIFKHPKSEFVAHFVGVRNFFKVRLTGEDKNIALSDHEIGIKLLPQKSRVDGFILIRGEDIILSHKNFDSSLTNNFEGKVTEIIQGINGINVIVDVGIFMNAIITTETLHQLDLKEGTKIRVHFKAAAVKFIPG